MADQSVELWKRIKARGTPMPGINLRDQKVARLPDPNGFDEGLDVSVDPKIARLPDPNEFPELDLNEPDAPDVSIRTEDTKTPDDLPPTPGNWNGREVSYAPALDDKGEPTGGSFRFENETPVTQQTRQGMTKMPRHVYMEALARGEDPFAKYNEVDSRDSAGQLGAKGPHGFDSGGPDRPLSRFEKYDAETPGPGFDAKKDYFPTDKPKAVVAKAKALKSGPSKDLLGAFDRAAEPEAARKPLVAKGDAAPDTSAQKQPEVDTALSDARAAADRADFAADMIAAGDKMARAGKKGGIEKDFYDGIRKSGQKPMDRLKEDRAAASAKEAKLLAAEDRLRKIGRDAEADRLAAAREKREADSAGGTRSHMERGDAETSRHNRAMEAIARAKGEGGGKGSGEKPLNGTQQARKDALDSIDLDLQRLDGLVYDKNGKPKASIPGSGIIKGSKYAEIFNGPEDDAVQQSVRNIISNLAQSRSGKTVSDREREMLMKSYGMNIGGVLGPRDQAFESGLRKFKEDVNLLKNGQMPKNPGAWPAHVLVGHAGTTDNVAQPPAGEQSKEIGGKRYVKRNGEWFEE